MSDKCFDGAVFYVDVLGIGSLTKENISVTNHPHVPSDGSPINQFVAAWVLREFRKALISVKRRYKDIRIAQLSDSAFVWSENPEVIAWAATDLMWRVLQKGLLCRGGIAYGEIISPFIKASALGKFVVGAAVTQAVDLERKGKGCRIFTDTNFPTEVLGNFSKSPLGRLLVQPLKILTDFSVVDEYKWYLLSCRGVPLLAPIINKKYLSKLFFDIMNIEAQLRYSPLFEWNSSNIEGRIHLRASIEALSSSISLFIENSPFDRSAEYIESLLGPRSNDIVNRVLNVYKKQIKSIKWNSRT